MRLSVSQTNFNSRRIHNTIEPYSLLIYLFSSDFMTHYVLYILQRKFHWVMYKLNKAHQQRFIMKKICTLISLSCITY